MEHKRRNFISCRARLLSACALLLATSAHVSSTETEYASCYAHIDGLNFTIGNKLIRRSWHLGDGKLTPLTFEYLPQDTSWLAVTEQQAAVGEEGKWEAEFDTDRKTVVAAKSLNVSLRYHSQNKSARYCFRVFDNVAAIEWTRQDNAGQENSETAIVDELTIPPERRASFTWVHLQDDTDRHNNLVKTSTEANSVTVFANIAYIEDKEGCGILFVKRGPLPHARTSPSSVDYEWEADHLIWRGPGVNAISGHGYPCATIAYCGSRAGRITALQDYYRSVRQYQPGRDGLLLSNTWGDRSQDAKVREKFLLKEIAAGKRLGIDVVEIDDGWQNGMTQNSASISRSNQGVWSGFWKTSDQFWTAHRERFPRGLGPVAQAANQAGLALGLWYAPDSEGEFSNWELDAERILELYREYGVRYFKLDSITMTTAKAENNVQHLLKRILEESHGEIVVDLDVTASVRPGYLGAIPAGNVFVENRYTEAPGLRKYWPHATLRNFWSLAEFVDPVRLRMEFLNNTRNQEVYNDDPLAPAAYPADYLFASVMFGSPLAWMEVSELPRDYADKARSLIAIWKQHREAIQSGHIIPIGSQPDGHQWTGFVSLAKDRQSGYAVIFRELNDHESATFNIPLLEDGASNVTILAGKGSAALENGKLNVELPSPLSYLFCKFGN